jgi:hypothetical protein
VVLRRESIGVWTVHGARYDQLAAAPLRVRESARRKLRDDRYERPERDAD